jgi:hypothetical protein
MPCKWVPVATAAQTADVQPSTVIAWCRRYGIGRKVGGRWRVDPDALAAILAGEAREAA